MQAISRDASSLQALGQFPGKQNVGQFTLAIGTRSTVRFLTVQVINVDRAVKVRNAGNVYDATGCSFLRGIHIKLILCFKSQ